MQAVTQAAMQARRTQQNMHGRGLKEPIAEGLEPVVAYHQGASIAGQGSGVPGGSAGGGVGFGGAVRSVPDLQQGVEQQHGQVLALIGPSRVQAGQHCLRQPLHEVCLPLHTCNCVQCLFEDHSTNNTKLPTLKKRLQQLLGSPTDS